MTFRRAFIAIDTGAFPDGDTFARRVDEQSKRVSSSKRAPGIDRVYAPGELAHTTRQNNAGVCTLSRQTFDSLIAAGKSAKQHCSNHDTTSRSIHGISPMVDPPFYANDRYLVRMSEFGPQGVGCRAW